jgi:quercetin dioxygenase-like cupin family protein
MNDLFDVMPFVRADGLYGTITAASYSWSGQLFTWPKVGQMEPHIAAPIPCVKLGTYYHPSHKQLSGTLRDPSTLEPTGLCLHEYTFKANEEVAEHSHVGDALNILTSGEAKWVLSTGQVLHAKAGDTVQIPGGTVYKLQALQDTRMLTTCIIIYI